MGLEERWNISSFSLDRIGQCTCLPAWQFVAGYAQLHGFALPHGAETARRCVQHSLLERPGPKGLSPLGTQGLFGSRMGRFSTFCVSKVEKKSLSLSLSLSLSVSVHMYIYIYTHKRFINQDRTALRHVGRESNNRVQ